MAKSKPKSQPCAERGGRGVIPWATEVVTCAACDGTGKVSVQKSSSKDRG